jgi:hypothetical protein
LFILNAQLKRERVTGNAGINYERTLEAVFFMVNAFFACADHVMCMGNALCGQYCTYRVPPILPAAGRLWLMPV